MMADEEERKCESPPAVDEMELDDSGEDDEDEEDDEDDDLQASLVLSLNRAPPVKGTRRRTPKADLVFSPAVSNFGPVFAAALSGKPLTIRRRRGRPKKGDPDYSPVSKKALGIKIKRWKG